jgi:hypothetical protein
MQAEEKHRAAMFGLAFEPSHILKAVVYFALVVAMGPIDGYDGNSFLPPRLDVENLWGIHVSKPKVDAEAYDRQFKLEAAARAERAKSIGAHAVKLRHAEEIERINAEHEEIRKGIK